MLTKSEIRLIVDGESGTNDGIEFAWKAQREYIQELEDWKEAAGPAVAYFLALLRKHGIEQDLFRQLVQSPKDVHKLVEWEKQALGMLGRIPRQA